MYHGPDSMMAESDLQSEKAWIWHVLSLLLPPTLQSWVPAEAAGLGKVQLTPLRTRLGKSCVHLSDPCTRSAACVEGWVQAGTC